MADRLNAAAVDKTSIEIDVRRSFAAVRFWIITHAAQLGCAAMLTLMSVQMLVVISRKSITNDEIVMIPSGYYHLTAQNFELIFEHPPFAKIIAALPLLFIQPDEIRSDQIVGTPGSTDERWAHMEKFWENNPDKFSALSFWPRVFMIGLTVGLGLLVFSFAKELFGPVAALLAVMLFALEPTVLAHGRVVQTDIPATFGYLLFFFMLRRYALNKSIGSSLWLGFAAGLAVLTKFSMLLVGPILVVYFAIDFIRSIRRRETWNTRVIHLALVALMSLLTINAAYFFRHRHLESWDVQWIREAFPGTAGPLIILTRILSHLVPADFVLGILRQLWHNAVGHSAGFLGMYSRTGWWYYYPVAFALKTTIPFLIASLAGLAWSGREVVRKRNPNHLWMLAPFVIYTVYVFFSRIDIGVRYYLPAYPFLFILGGALLASLWRSRKAARAGMIAAILMLTWIGLEAVRAYPNHMSYMNQLASRAPHWWYLSDSNVEWGDDLRDLAIYLRARGETKVREATLGGYLTLRFYGIERIDAMTSRPGENARYTAIGASFLNGSTNLPDNAIAGRKVGESQDYFAAYRQRQPEAVFGNSIYLYREDLDGNQ
jgi:hypothetical protein